MPPALYSRFDPHARTGFVDEPWLLHLAQPRPVRAPRATTGRRMGMMRGPWRRAIHRTRARLLRIYEGRRSCACPKPTELDACRLRWHPRGRRGGVGHATARALSSSPPAAGHLLPPDGRRSAPHPPVPTLHAGFLMSSDGGRSADGREASLVTASRFSAAGARAVQAKIAGLLPRRVTPTALLP